MKIRTTSYGPVVLEDRITRIVTAIDDETYDGTSASPIGWGENEQEAIADLTAKVEDSDA